MSPDRPHLCMPPGRSLARSATLDAVAAGVPDPPMPPHAPSTTSTTTADTTPRMRPTLRDALRTPPCLEKDGSAARQELAESALDPFAHLLAQLQHKA